MRPADAHDAGESAPNGPADAPDASLKWFKVRPADADYAGSLATSGPKCAQLMLMMLAG